MNRGISNAMMGVLVGMVLVLVVIGTGSALSGEARTRGEQGLSVADQISCSVAPFQEKCEDGGGTGSVDGMQSDSYRLDSQGDDVIDVTGGPDITIIYDDFQEGALDGYSAGISEGECEDGSDTTDFRNCRDIVVDGKKIALAVKTASGDETYGNGDSPIHLYTGVVDGDAAIAVGNEGDNAWALEEVDVYEEVATVEYDTFRCMSTDPSDCGGFSGDSSKTPAVSIDAGSSGSRSSFAVQLYTDDRDNAGTDSGVDICDSGGTCYPLSITREGLPEGRGREDRRDLYNDRQRGKKDTYVRDGNGNVISFDSDATVHLRIRGDDAWFLKQWTIYEMITTGDMSDDLKFDPWICLTDGEETEGWCEGEEHQRTHWLKIPFRTSEDSQEGDEPEGPPTPGTGDDGGSTPPSPGG